MKIMKKLRNNDDYLYSAWNYLQYNFYFLSCKIPEVMRYLKWLTDYRNVLAVYQVLCFLKKSDLSPPYSSAYAVKYL